jgi:hypothetical protein
MNGLSEQHSFANPNDHGEHRDYAMEQSPSKTCVRGDHVGAHGHTRAAEGESGKSQAADEPADEEKRTYESQEEPTDHDSSTAPQNIRELHSSRFLQLLKQYAGESLMLTPGGSGVDEASTLDALTSILSDSSECIGRVAEQLVWERLESCICEPSIMAELGLEDGQSPANVEWSNKQVESGLPYDLVLRDGDGDVLAYIEIKTSLHSAQSQFVLSTNEFEMAAKHPQKYHVLFLPELATQVCSGRGIEVRAFTRLYEQLKTKELKLVVVHGKAAALHAQT